MTVYYVCCPYILCIIYYVFTPYIYSNSTLCRYYFIGYIFLFPSWLYNSLKLIRLNMVFHVCLCLQIFPWIPRLLLSLRFMLWYLCCRSVSEQLPAWSALETSCRFRLHNLQHVIMCVKLVTVRNQLFSIYNNYYKLIR